MTRRDHAVTRSRDALGRRSGRRGRSPAYGPVARPARDRRRPPRGRACAIGPQQFVNALTLGAIYALIALGYTMVYGIIELINFAHGDVFMVGAFVSLIFLTIARLATRSITDLAARSLVLAGDVHLHDGRPRACSAS